jgi:uncharacterized pyridoxamine 5'-phosphate oxidase family protein
MDLNDCVKCANENPDPYIAINDGDQPHVRAFAMWYADTTGFYYHTGTPKSVWKQLMKNPKRELCFLSPGGGQGVGKVMRVCGNVEFLENKSLEERLFRDRHPPQPYYYPGRYHSPTQLSSTRIETYPGGFHIPVHKQSLGDRLRGNTLFPYQ